MRLLLACLLSLASWSLADTAVWLRPPATPQALTRELQAAKQAGFTDVLLEGFYHGRAAWTTDAAPPKLTYDALAVAAPLARQLGLRLSAWVEVTYWRPAPEFGIPVTPLWQDRYATLSREGQPSLAVSKLGFVDPADPEVGAIMERVVRDLATRYPDVGLHLDYLRYPREADFGYHPTAVRDFTARFGADPRTLRPPRGDDPGDPLLAQWTAYRQGLVTALARRLIGAYRGAGGQGRVTAAVYGGADPLQRWQDWTGLQAAMPMFYFPANALYPLALIGWPRGEGVWPGVKVGPGLPPLDSQLATLRALGYLNVSVFGWTPPAP